MYSSPWPLNWLYVFTICGISLMQVVQSVAQKLIRWPVPLSWSVEIFSPDSSVNVAAGTGLDELNANQPASATTTATKATAAPISGVFEEAVRDMAAPDE